MLVLSRRQEESVLIGDDIVVKVIKTANNSVKLGVEAPADMPVDRAEVRERKIKKQIQKQEKSNASNH